MGDMLAAQGYKTGLLCFGSEGEFAGRKQYFEGHGNYEVKDLLYAQQNGLIPSDYRVWWGYEDHKLYDLQGRKWQTWLTADNHLTLRC